MLPIFDGVRDVTVLSTTLRMLLAVAVSYTHLTLPTT